MLPNDIARCMGVGYTEDGERIWRDGCEDCQRRTDIGGDGWHTWTMEPPKVIVFECEYRIEP